MDQDINLESTQQFINRVIESATDGETRAYLISAANSHLVVNETAVRNGFAKLRDLASEPDARGLAYQCMRNINAFYRTRYPLLKLNDVVEIAFSAVEKNGWWYTEPPVLFTCEESDIELLGRFIPDVLKQMADEGLNNPYSLITKWLHFCFPNSFVIYDAQAVSSIQTWSFFTYPLTNTICEQYAARETGKVDGTSYASILDFYRFCWNSCSSEQQSQLQVTANQISRDIAAFVSPIDLIDKLLWMANGDPRRMGFL